MIRADRQPRRRLTPEERREAILAAAAVAFAADPFDRVALGAIAERAGASEALVHKYFSSKAGLYTDLVRRGTGEVGEGQAAAVAALPPGAPAREQVKACTAAYLDHVRANPVGPTAVHIVPPSEPEAAGEVRRLGRRRDVARLRGFLLPTGWERHAFALEGFYGFLDAGCVRWVDRGCPEALRWPLADAALGALEGALGDWGR